MGQVICPNCGAQIPHKEVDEGWCECCGKKIPAFALRESSALPPALAESGESASPEEFGTKLNAQLLANARAALQSLAENNKPPTPTLPACLTEPVGQYEKRELTTGQRTLIGLVMGGGCAVGSWFGGPLIVALALAACCSVLLIYIYIRGYMSHSEWLRSPEGQQHTRYMRYTPDFRPGPLVGSIVIIFLVTAGSLYVYGYLTNGMTEIQSGVFGAGLSGLLGFIAGYACKRLK